MRLSPQPSTIHTIRPGEGVAQCTCKINYNNYYDVCRWSTLEIHGVPGNSDNDIAYYAGYIEGNQTGELIYMTYINSVQSGDILCTQQSNSAFCEQVASFIDSNLQYMSRQINEKPGSEYWHMVC